MQSLFHDLLLSFNYSLHWINYVICLITIVFQYKVTLLHIGVATYHATLVTSCCISISYKLGFGLFN